MASAASQPTERRVDQLLAHYGSSHQHATNEVIHFVAIPLIVISLVGLMFALHPWLAYSFVAASLVYYARLSWVFFVSMCIWSMLTVAIVHLMGEHVLTGSLLIFVGAWIMQFVGHKIEDKKPSFFEDIQYLWVGPIFVLSKLFSKFNIRW
jgi:uncharacterized membrane protein YGL010W